MGIPFLGEVEKLINEHGSAAILKERIALANDKYAALEAKVADLTAKIAILEAYMGSEAYMGLYNLRFTCPHEVITERRELK